MLNRLFNSVCNKAPGLLSANFAKGNIPIQQIRSAADKVITRPQTNKEYFLSTHFWGPVANWGFVIAVSLFQNYYF